MLPWGISRDSLLGLEGVGSLACKFDDGSMIICDADQGKSRKG